MIKTRDAYWDNLKSILMLLTVFAHILFQMQNLFEIINFIVDLIYSFHMPAFVFVSGYFGKSENSRSFKGIIKLIILYFIFNTLMGFTYGFTSLLQPVYSFWYLIALVAWRLTAHHIAKFKEIILILFVVAIFAGFYSDINNTFAIARIIGFYPWYMMGFLMTKEKNNELLNKKASKRISLGLAAALCTVLLFVLGNSFFQFSDHMLQMGAFGLPINAFGRIVLYIIAFLGITALRCITMKKEIPIVTMMGKNSLWIYVLHRPLTLLASDFLIEMDNPIIIILLSVPITIAICLITGNNLVTKYLDKFLYGCVSVFVPSDDNKKHIVSRLALTGVALIFVTNVISSYYANFTFEDFKNFITGEKPVSDSESDETDTPKDIIYPVMNNEQKADFEKAFRITFAGDLILLEDQVKRAYNGKEYDFSEVFSYAKPYISSADLAIGVFEGPMAGEDAGYTAGNYDDGKKLYLNFPDSFATAVKDAGFDLVTTANNHLLDKGEKGALRTLDVLDRVGLDHTGSYRNEEEKKNNHIKIIELEGMKFAVLSYTYGSNYISNDTLMNGELSYITNLACGTQGEEFEMLKSMVEQDFADAKALSPDFIIVLPHMGTQFLNSPDEEQTTWFNIFKENGADIILGDHPHSVQPATIEEYQGKDVFTAYCPGNFANIYRKNQGDTSMLIDVYIDPDTKEIIGGGIVPLYTHSRADGNYRAVPIYEIMNNKELRSQLTTDDIVLAENANNIITRVVFGSEMDISSVTERYYFNKEGFLRNKVTGVSLTEEMKEGTLYSEMSQVDSVCFIGDSITEGTKNGGCPWYEPVEEFFPDKKILNYSKGGCTVSYMIEKAEEIPDASLYVVALGTNDVRYRDESTCAMTAKDYVSAINELSDKLKQKPSFSKIIFIAPWYSTDGDKFTKLSFEKKTSLNNEFTAALDEYCKENSIPFINVNPKIREMLTLYPQGDFLLDHIHPNSSKGVIMYSEVVLSAG